MKHDFKGAARLTPGPSFENLGGSPGPSLGLGRRARATRADTAAWPSGAEPRRGTLWRINTESCSFNEDSLVSWVLLLACFIYNIYNNNSLIYIICLFL